MIYKKLSLVLILLVSFSLFGQEKNITFSFETEQEYVDFVYSLHPVLHWVYPKSSLGWVQRNTSQYETDLSNVILLADIDFKKKGNKSFAQVALGNFEESIPIIISSGSVLFAKRKKVTGDEASWIVIIGYIDNGKTLIINDSKIGPGGKIPTNSIDAAYYLK